MAKPQEGVKAQPAVSHIQPIQNRTLWQSYTSLPSRTRLAISLGLCLIGITGIVASDYLEKRIPPPEQK